MQIEEWKEIYNLPNYFVSNNGIIKGKRGIIKTHPTKKGYLIFRIPHLNYTKSVHRLVAIHFIENPNNKDQVNHIDGNKFNNNRLNLEWISCKENIHHAIETGLRKRSINLTNRHIFNESSLIKIRELFNLGIKNPEIAKMYNCHHSTISKIRTNKHYKSC